jgi:hypothetical protein
LVADWNFNNYHVPTADNVPAEDDEGFDIEAFPIESIAEPNRPTKGIIKARVNEATVNDGTRQAFDPRFYIGDVNDVYKYWTSPYRTNTSGVFPLHTDGLTSCKPFILYPKVVRANKIVIKVENTWATPLSYEVRLRASVGQTTWDGAIGGSNPAIDLATGTLTLYFNGSGWVTTRPAVLVQTNVAGIQFRVNSLTAGRRRNGAIMKYRKGNYNLSGSGQWGRLESYDTNGSKSSLNLIAIEAHFEKDLTDRLITVSDDFEMGETSQLYPIGTLTTNIGDLNLSNEDGIFNRDNTTSDYYGLMEPKVNFNLEYIYTIGTTQYSVQQFNLNGGPWRENDGVVDISLEDQSEHLKAIKPRACLYENQTVPEIIWSILDSVGFNNYVVDQSDMTTEHTIPFFWGDGDSTAWELLDEVAKSTQTAIYFDAYGQLQVKTRDAAFKDTAPVDWNLLGETSGTNLADIESLSVNNELEANKIEVKYRSTKWAVNRIGKHALSKVWEPDGDTVTLRSSPLKRSIDGASTAIFLDEKEIAIWPFKSKVDIEGEIIQYDGKRYVYYTGENGLTANYVTVKDQDEVTKYDRKTPVGFKFKNQFTGGLDITERGVWNSEKRNHSVDINNWSTKQLISGTGVALVTSNIGGFTQNRTQSTATINTPSTFQDSNDFFWAKRNTAGSNAYKMYGTKLKFLNDQSSSTQRGGLAFNLNGASEYGYYVEVCLSGTLDSAVRQTRNEVTIWSKTADGMKIISKGEATAVARGLWYELDVYIKPGTQDEISAWINGQRVALGTTTAATKQPANDIFGMYARGKSNIEFEFFYAIARPNLTEPADDFGFYDLKYGGVRGGLWEKEHKWRLKTRWKKIKKGKWKKETYRFNEYFFDEFGPYIHEIREYSVTFSTAPCQYSYLFSTNDWYSATLEYAATPFGADFVVANIGRNHAIIKGEDNLLYGGAEAGVNQVFTVLGRTLNIEDEESIKRENKLSIRKRGPIESELSSDFIQSRAMAVDIANWMTKHWSEGVDEVDVEIFGNPLIEIGDIVDINYPERDMTPATHKYFVVKTSTSFDMGLSTSLTLRRVRSSTNIS